MCEEKQNPYSIIATLTRDLDMDSGVIRESLTFDPSVTLDQSSGN